MGVDESLPGALAWQRWLGLRRGRRGRCQVTRWPGGLVRCWPAGGDAWDAASQDAANLWWVHLVLSLFQVADRPTQPAAQTCCRCPEPSGHHRSTRAATAAGPPSARPRGAFRNDADSAGTSCALEVADASAGLRFSGQLLQSSTRSSSSQSRQAATGVATRMPQARPLGRESHLLRRRVGGWVTRIVQQYLSADDRRDVSLPTKPEAVAR